jgi:hypothetical protein
MISGLSVQVVLFWLLFFLILNPFFRQPTIHKPKKKKTIQKKSYPFNKRHQHHHHHHHHHQKIKKNDKNAWRFIFNPCLAYCPEALLPHKPRTRIPTYSRELPRARQKSLITHYHSDNPRFPRG